MKMEIQIIMVKPNSNMNCLILVSVLLCQATEGNKDFLIHY